jgi:2-polyprenyl-3-methyl-5-hydroxy-6-metoxy-1,4-benzoquinol methylase
LSQPNPAEKLSENISEINSEIKPEIKPEEMLERISDRAQILERASLLKVKSLIAARGELAMPCIPSLLEHHFNQIHALLQALGQNFSASELQTLRKTLDTRLKEGFAASPYARITFRYEPPNPMAGITKGLRISFHLNSPTTEDKYQGWVKNREGALFGTDADAKVMAIAKSLAVDSQPQDFRILDIGAGPGRNTLPLARKGFAIDAIELAPIFAEQLRSLVASENLKVNVVEGDVLQTETKIRTAHYNLILVAEVISHFRNLDQVKLLLARMCDALKPGGHLLLSTFVTTEGYQPNQFIRELAQMSWSFLITPSELLEAIANLPFTILSEESAFEYEKTHLPSEAFPPTPWFSSWATGRDLFPMEEAPPANLQWILLQRI